MSQNPQNPNQTHTTPSPHEHNPYDLEQNYSEEEKYLDTQTLMFAIKRDPNEVYERIILQDLEDNSPESTNQLPYSSGNYLQAQQDEHLTQNHQENEHQFMEEGEITLCNGGYQNQAQFHGETYQENQENGQDDDGSQVVPTSSNPDPDTLLTPIVTETPSLSVQPIQDQEKGNQTVERYESDTQHNEQPQSRQQAYLSFTKIPPHPAQSLPDHQYNSYLQAVLNTPINMSTEPTDADLTAIHQALKVQLSAYKPEQIYILLYNNLIRGPRQTLIEAQAKECDPTIKYDGGHKYWTEINLPNNNSAKYEMSNFELRKQMIGVYVTKGYGLKVFQDQLKTINPNAPEIDKEKFKKHFIEIYKITMRKVEEFLTRTADRQFQPLKKQQYQKPLSDVINCKKHYSPQFCQVFYRILQATFDVNFQNVPNEQQVIFFYKTIMEKLRNSDLKLVKKLHQPEEQKDTDIWTKEFQETFIRAYINLGQLAKAKAKLIEMYPECEAFITNEKLTHKLENAIRTSIRYLVVSNTQCGNQVPFQPTDMDRKFIMKEEGLKESRIKLLKVYVKRPTDAQVLQNIVSYINEQLRVKYEMEGVPAEVIRNAQARQLPREVERSGLESLLKSQLMRNY